METQSIPSQPIHGPMLECPNCGLMNHIGHASVGTDLYCPRCLMTLKRIHKYYSLDIGIAWALVAAVFYLVSVTTPLLKFGIYGHYRSGMLSTGTLALDDQGFWALAAVVFFTVLVTPLVKIAGTLVVLTALKLRKKSLWLGRLYALTQHISQWIMVEVFLLGFLVAYSRLERIGTLQLSSAIFGLAGLMASLVAMRIYINPEQVWSRIRLTRTSHEVAPQGKFISCGTCHQINRGYEETTCCRCDEILHHRKPESLSRAWALTIAAAVLYIPSNIYPVMTIWKLGRRYSYTIFGGLMELSNVGLWPLAALVFIASIAIPVFKILAMGYMLEETRRQSLTHRPLRAKLYRVLDFIGRWSMVDVFVVSILVGLVRFGFVSQVVPEQGAVYFAGVVLLTLLAVRSFDPRLMWDGATNLSRREQAGTHTRSTV